MPGWRWRRQPAAAEVAVPASGPVWDACIDLCPDDLPHGVPHAVAADAVTAAVQAMPGAGWVSVEVHAAAARALVRLFAAGTGGAPGDAAYVRTRVDVVVRGALAALPAVPRSPPRPPRPPHPIAGAFAEAAAAPAFAGFSEAPLPATPTFRPAAAAVSRVSVAPGPGDVALTSRVLAFVLPGAAAGEDGAGPAAAAVDRFGSFAGVLSAPEAELREVPGLGTHSVAALKLVHEAALRLAHATVSAQPVLDSRERLYAYLSAAVGRERVEQFRVLFLDERGMLRADEVLGTGTVNHTPVYPREVVRRALELKASAVVLVHNHPSGDPAPSQDDISMTEAVQAAAGELSIGVRDHIIVGAGRWVSMAEAGLM